MRADGPPAPAATRSCLAEEPFDLVTSRSVASPPRTRPGSQPGPGAAGLLEYGPSRGIINDRRLAVAPVRHRHRRLFGDGFHRFTLDTVRTGGVEDRLG